MKILVCRAGATLGHQLVILQSLDKISFTKAAPDSYIVVPILEDLQWFPKYSFALSLLLDLFVCFLVSTFPCWRLCRSSFLIHQSKLFYLTWFHLGRTVTDMLISFYRLKSYTIIDCNIYSGSLLLFVLFCSVLFSKIDITACLFPVWYLTKSSQLKQSKSSSTNAMNAPNIHQV